MAGSSVVGLGAGVIIILIVWTLTLVAWVQLSNQYSGLRVLVAVVSLTVTLSLFLIPTEDRRSTTSSVTNPDLLAPQDSFQVYDYNFLWKGSLMLLMLVMLMGSFAVYLKEFWAAKIHGAVPISRKKFEEYN